ncbi:MAG: hypothetical protein PVF17_00735 [Ignavibacteria bacterium]|jgi:hypothetical protein
MARADFANSVIYNQDSDFTYGSDIAFDSGLKLGDKRPANSIFYSAFSSTIDTTWTFIDGYNLTGVPTGGASISGGWLDLKGDTVQYLDYAIAPGTIADPQNGAGRMVFKSNYSGSPSSIKVAFMTTRAHGDNRNLLAVFHNATGQLSVQIRDYQGNIIINQGLGVWSPVAGTEYEIEFNYDLDAGIQRLFIDGVQFGGTLSGTGTRDNNISLVRIGSGSDGAYASDFEVKDTIVFTEMQHTADYTPGETIAQTPYVITNPSFVTNNSLTADEIISFVENSTKTGNDEIKYIIKRDDNYLYWDGSAWITSDETYSQSNTAIEISTNISSINNDDENEYYMKGFLHSDNGLTTPVLTSFEIGYFILNFVVEDGTSKTDATSYATEAQFVQYWLSKGADYSSESTIDIKQWLNAATEYIDISYIFEGEKTDINQALEWPRYGVTDRFNYSAGYMSSNTIDSNEIPQQIIDATCYLAAQQKQENLNVVDNGIKSESYGPVSKTYSKTSSAKQYIAVDKMLKWLILQGNKLIRVN